MPPSGLLLEQEQLQAQTDFVNSFFYGELKHLTSKLPHINNTFSLEAAILNQQLDNPVQFH